MKNINGSFYDAEQLNELMHDEQVNIDDDEIRWKSNSTNGCSEIKI